jgi:pyrroloquinoline quinone biosynthesis protein D
MIQPHARLKIAYPFRLQWEAAQGCFVLLYPEGMVKLNESSGMILDQCCKGQKTVEETIVSIANDFSEDADSVRDDIQEFLEVAYENRWIEEC